MHEETGTANAEEQDSKRGRTRYEMEMNKKESGDEQDRELITTRQKKEIYKIR